MTRPCHFGFVYETRYDVFTILSASITMFQLLLFAHTMYNEYSQRNCNAFEQSKTMRILYIILQMLAILAVLCDHLRYTIDSHTGVLRHHFGCRLVVYAPWYISGLYWGTYFSLLCYRLQSSFHDSFLALSRWTLYTLWALALLPPVTVTTSMAMSRPDLECIETWHPPDLSHPIKFCELQFDMLIPVKYHIFPGLIVLNTVLSITFCVIFCVKLKQFLRTQHSVTSPHRMDRCAGIEFQRVILKMSILTVIGALSTIIAYVLRFNIYDYGHIFLYADWLVNCLVIGLMFKHNRWYFKMLCGPCLLICDRTDSEQELERYMSERSETIRKMTSTLQAIRLGNVPSATATTSETVAGGE